MITRSYIEKNLLQIDYYFRRSRTQKEPLYYSKLAVMELCGWLELTTDDLVLRAVKKGVKNPNKVADFEANVIEKNYGFHYKKNLRPMFCRAVGEIIVHEIEEAIDQTKKAQLISELGTLTVNRNKLAHTYLKGVTHTIDAPSQTIARFALAYGGLKEFEKELFLRL